MTHGWVVKTLVFNRQGWCIWVSFKDRAVQVKVLNKSDCPSSCNGFHSNGFHSNYGQWYYGRGMISGRPTAYQHFTRGVSNHNSNTYCSQFFKNRVIEVCFQGAQVSWLPDGFLWWLLDDRLDMKMLIFFKMLLCQFWEFVQWHHCLLGSNFVSMIPYELASCDEKLRSLRILPIY